MLKTKLRTSLPFFVLRVLLLFAAALSSSSVAGAAPAEGILVKEIVFDSPFPHRHEDLRKALLFQEGERTTEEKISQSIQALMERGVFEEVIVDLSGVTTDDQYAFKVTFLLIPLPFIVDVEFRGNNALADNELIRSLGLSRRRPLEEKVVERLIYRLKSKYDSEGFRKANIVSQYRALDDSGATTVILIIDEGEAAKISDISLDGRIPSIVEPGLDSLRDALIGSTASEKVINEIRELITLAFRKEGYLQAFVEQGEVVFDRDANAVSVRYPITPRTPVSITFSGNTVFTELELLSPLRLESRKVPFSPIAIRSLRREIVEMYQRRGYYHATASLKEVERDGRRRIFRIEINEGPVVKLEDVRFEGAQPFSKSFLKSITETSPTPVFFLRRWFHGYLIDSQLKTDRERIAAELRADGYLDARVSSDVIFDESKTEAIVRFLIEAGERYRVLSVEVVWEGIVEMLSSPVAGSMLDQSKALDFTPAITEGEPFILAKLEEEQNRLVSYLGDNGFPFAEVALESGEQLGAIIFRVNLGRPVRVGEIELFGNRFTKDSVLRRALSIEKGSLWSNQDIADSERALFESGLFSSVTIDAADGELNESIEGLEVAVTERETGRLSGGILFNTEDGLHLRGELAQRNMLGSGQTVGLGFDGFIESGSHIFDAGRARLSHRVPYFFSPNTELLSEGFVEYSIQLFDDFTYDRVGLSSLVRHRFSETLTVDTGLTIYKEEISDAEPDVIIGPRDDGQSAYAFPTLKVSFDGRDDPFNPTGGHYESISAKVATEVLGSDLNFWWLSGEHSHFISLGSSWVWGNHLQAIYIEPFGDTEVVPLSNRLFLGGRDSLRGFSRNAVGPRGTLGNIVGGDRSLSASTELTYALTDSFLLLGFFDIGQAFLENEGSFDGRELDEDDFRLSPGGGIRYKTPIGPLSVEYGVALDREFGERFGRLHIAIGGAF